MLTSAVAADILDDLLSGTLYLAFLTTNPTRAGLLTGELSDSGTGYARPEVTGLFTATDTTTRIATLNAIVVTAMPLTRWTVPYVALMDGGTVGADTMLAYQRLSQNIVAEIGAPHSFLPGQLKFRIG